MHMLNYVWAGLIILSFVFGIASDVLDISRDTYQNGTEITIGLSSDLPLGDHSRLQDVTVHIDPSYFQSVYGTDKRPDSTYSGQLVRSAEGIQLRFAQGVPVPEPWATIRSETSPRDNDLRGVLTMQSDHATSAVAHVTFSDVKFVKMHAIAAAAISMAETAVSLALGLIGVIALWMGLLKIAEVSGLIHSVVRLTQPLLRPLFPEIPKDHPAFGLIVLNLTANMLGLGNAATPLGIKAMEELQTLNPDPDTATNSMVMLLAMNTASVQLVPPVLLVALMGLQINELIFAILIVTSTSLVVAILAAKTLSKLKIFRTTPVASKETSNVGGN